MTTFDSKPRPIEERIAELVGKTAYKIPAQGFGGIPNVSSLDVAAALVWCRRNRKRIEAACEIGPELLMAYYASDDSGRGVLRAAYLREHPTKGDDRRVRMIQRRIAATVAAQIVAGRKYSRPELDEYAYLANVRSEVFRSEVGMAEAWLMLALSGAQSIFLDALRDAVEQRVEREREDRKSRLAA